MKALTDLYKELDETVAKHLNTSPKPITCRRGCAHCCHILTTALVPEGALIARHLLKQKNWMKTARKLRSAAIRTCDPELNRVKYFEDNKPCVFLNGHYMECSIYNIRPAACRYHYVITPPSYCAPEHPGGEIHMVNLMSFEAQVWKHCQEVTRAQLPVASPIALMVLHCLDFALEGSTHQSFTQRMLEGLPNPLEWERTLGVKISKEIHETSHSEVEEVLKAQVEVGMLGPKEV